MTTKSKSLSGLSVALGFVVFGVVFGYFLPEAYGDLTRYFSATLILIGVLGFFTELAKRLTGSQIRLDNAGVGIFLLVPSVYATFFVYTQLTGWWRAILVTITAFFILLGIMAVIDMLVSIFEELVGRKRTGEQVVGFLKFLALLISSAAAVLVSVRQLLG